MTISVRLDPKTTALLDKFAEQSGRSKSDVLRDSLQEYLQKHAGGKSPYELIAPYLGCVDSGRPDLGSNHSQILKEKLRARARRD